MVKKYRSIPTVIEAIQYTGDNVKELEEWGQGKIAFIEPEDRGDDPDCDLSVMDDLHSTWINVYQNQWIIKGTKGEFYPCDPEVFAQKYKEVDDGAEEQQS